ncbi:MAG: hypothetical protein R6U58_12035 [Bacteroidales bacterium]
MKTQIFRHFFPAGLILMLLVSSCGGRQEGESRVITGDQETTEITSRTGEGLEEYPIPTAVEVVELLQDAGAPYILGISNPVSNVDRYFTEKSKALNLGVYGADLSYAGTYEMQQDIMKYLGVCKQLIEELNISTSFNQGFVQRVENNLENKDSLINIVSESFYDTYIFLTGNHRDDLALLVMTGSWIEGMYLTAQIAIGARENREITNIILQQDEPLEKLLSLLDEHEDDSLVYSLYQDLNEILEFLEDQESPMDDEALDSFNEKIELLRTEVID